MCPRPRDTEQEGITLSPEFGVDPEEGDHCILITSTSWSTYVSIQTASEVAREIWWDVLEYNSLETLTSKDLLLLLFLMQSSEKTKLKFLIQGPFTH